MCVTDKREEALSYIKELGEQALLEFFYAAMKDRPERWFIGYANADANGDGHILPAPNKTEKRVLARPDHAAYQGADWDEDAPMIREAWCTECDTGLISVAKYMICPVCGCECRGH